jgi:TRAP-type C4-dicarboxylate transport system permease large subunit
VRPKGQIRDVMIGSLPFVVALLAMIVLLVLLPDLALWLPNSIAR